MTPKGDARVWPAATADSLDHAIAAKHPNGVETPRDKAAEQKFSHDSDGTIGPVVGCTIPSGQVDDLEMSLSRIERYLFESPHTLEDQELLELGLFIALGDRDIRPVARALLARYRTLGGVIAAPTIELSAFRDLGKKGVTLLKFVRASAVNVLRKEVSTAPVISSWDQLMDYLSVSLKHEQVEEFHVLFLDGRGALIADEIQGRGTINQAPAYPREIARRCLELNASSIIMVHNHPSGDPTPSRQDIVMTQGVERAVATMGILLHDHVIIGRFGSWSLRREKRM